MKKYQVIYADPPWPYSSRAKTGDKDGRIVSIKEKYPTLKIDDICKLNISSIADDNSVLFIWTIDAFLEQCLKVIDCWGFTYKTIGFVWHKKHKSGKECILMAPWTMKSTEICLLATKGKPKRVKCNVRSYTSALRRSHSKKPDEVRDKIVSLMGRVPRIELFATEKTRGWDVGEIK